LSRQTGAPTRDKPKRARFIPSPAILLTPNEVGYNGGVSEIGKLLILLGAVLALLGAAFLLLGRAHVPLGRLPGDFTYRGKHTVVYFPLATSIVVSLLLTLLFYIIGRFRH
jgi:membrane associated rhomboid family serine protease